MEQLFDIESGIEKEFSYANAGKKAKRKAKRAKKDEDIVSGKKKKGFFGKAFGAAKKGGLAPMRGSALALIRLNLWGMATKMAKLQKLSPTVPAAKTHWIKIVAHWIKFGGDKAGLFKAIDAGKNKHQLLSRKSKQIANPDEKKRKKKKHNFSGQEGEFFDNAFQEEFSNLEPVTTSALITAAGTVLATIVATLGRAKGIVGDMPLTADDQAKLNEASPSDALTTADIAKGAEEVGKTEAEDSQQIFGMPSTVVYIGGLILFGIVLWAMNRKGKS